jgi:tetratricopeptide (TPR) repeat protein
MPDDGEYSFQSGMKAFKAKQYSEAVVHFTHVIQEKSDIHKVYNALGVTYSKIGNDKDAELCFEKALVLDPQNPTYGKNLGKVSQKKKSMISPGISKQRPRYGQNSWKDLLMLGILLLVVAVIIFFFMLFQIQVLSFHSLPWEGSHEGGLLQPLLQSLIPQERIYPTASISVKNKRIEYLFDRHQDLSQIKKIEASITIQDGTRIDFPVVWNPQKNVYYGIDDPFLRKEKKIVMTGYFQDDVSAVLADIVLPPR